MNFIKDNSKIFAVGALGLVAGASLFFLLTRRNPNKETALSVPPGSKSEDPTNSKALLKMLLEKIAQGQPTEALLKEVGKDIFGYIWRRTLEIDSQEQSKAFSSSKKLNFSALVDEIINGIVESNEQKNNLQREADEIINGLGLSLDQIAKVTAMISKLQQEQESHISEYIPLAKEYLSAKISVLSKNGRQFTNKLKEYKWNEQNSHLIFSVLNVLINLEAYAKSTQYLDQNLQLSMAIEKFEDEFKTLKQQWDRLIEPIYLELPFRPSFSFGA